MAETSKAMQDNLPPLFPLVLGPTPSALARALTQEGIAWVHQQAAPQAGRFVLFDSRIAPTVPVQAGQLVIDVAPVCEAATGCLCAALDDTSTARRMWFAGRATVQETVSMHHKRDLQRRLMARLRMAIEDHGGLWLRLGAVPNPYRTAFHLRIDYDDYHAADFAGMLTELRGYEHATSHYVTSHPYLNEPEALARLRGLDVGTHGYYHHTYRAEEDNRRNISRGLEHLAASGLDPRGFVAPHGKNPPHLASLLQELGIEYSSEFQFAYDDWPRETSSGHLQIPVHPVCLGSFVDQAYTGSSADEPSRLQLNSFVQAACDYFERVIRAKIAAREPVFLYDHPTRRLGRHPRFLQAVFQAASAARGLWWTDMRSFADWWRARSKVQWVAQVRNGRVECQVQHRPANARLTLECWRGDHVCMLPIEGPQLAFDPAALAYERSEQAVLPEAVRVDQGAGLKATLRRYLDWEHETPVAEIPAHHWRGWFKRTLRRWKTAS